MSGLPAAILDIDGTLVDTNYHHAIAWYRAFRRTGSWLPLWRIHRHIGMGGDQLVAALDRRGVRAEHGDDVRDAEKQAYMALIGEVAPLEGARELLLETSRSAATRSCSPRRRSRTRSSTTSTCSTRATLVARLDHVRRRREDEAQPDLVNAAIEKAGGGDAVMIGDSTWDCEAAKRAKVATIGVLTGRLRRRRS